MNPCFFLIGLRIINYKGKRKRYSIGPFTCYSFDVLYIVYFTCIYLSNTGVGRIGLTTELLHYLLHLVCSNEVLDKTVTQDQLHQPPLK